MIKNYNEFSEFENELMSKEKVDIKQNFYIVEEMYKEAIFLGALPLKDPLEDIEVDINLAKILNSVSKVNS